MRFSLLNIHLTVGTQQYCFYFGCENFLLPLLTFELSNFNIKCSVNCNNLPKHTYDSAALLLRTSYLKCILNITCQTSQHGRTSVGLLFFQFNLYIVLIYTKNNIVYIAHTKSRIYDYVIYNVSPDLWQLLMIVLLNFSDLILMYGALYGIVWWNVWSFFLNVQRSWHYVKAAID